jgi:hypothetical protein
MRFTLRIGTEAEARADGTLLTAMGLPGGGVVAIGSTHVLVRPGETPAPSDLTLPEHVLANAGLVAGTTSDVTRATLPPAAQVVVAGEALPIDGRHLTRALTGRPVSNGDRIHIPAGYGSEDAPPPPLEVVRVVPDDAALVTQATAFTTEDESIAPPLTTHDAGRVAGDGPTTADALLAGLDTELEMLSAWISLLTSADRLPEAWGLPSVAGIVLEGPPGCGKSELVLAAAERAGATVREITVDLVFKPERLVDVLETAVKTTATPAVLFVDRLDAVAGDDGMFRTQVAAIMRWFLEAVGESDRLACVLGTSNRAALDDAVADSPMLPRTLSIPPPSIERRSLLFEAARHRLVGRARERSLGGLRFTRVDGDAPRVRGGDDTEPRLRADRRGPQLRLREGRQPRHRQAASHGIGHLARHRPESIRASRDRTASRDPAPRTTRHRQDVRRAGTRSRVRSSLLLGKGCRVARQVRG